MIRCSFVHTIRFLLIFGTLVNSLKEHRNNIDEDSNYGFSSIAQDSKSKNAFSTGRRGPVSPDSNRNLGSFFDSFLNEDRHLVQKEIPAHTLSSKKSDISQMEDIEESFLCGAYRAKFVVKQDSIIRTKESLAEGATFLLAPSDIHSNAECVRQCCSDVHCTLAVFDGKGRNSCYLFNCGKGNLCVFAEHSNYTSTLIRRLSGVNKEQERENELENLKGLGAMGAADELSRVGGASGPDVGGATAGDSSRGDAAPVRDATTPTSTPGDVVPTTTSTTVATTLAVTTAPAVHYVSLLQPCSQDDQCQDVNAVCDNVCICKPNMKPSFGKCADVEEARRCSRLEFACRSVVRGRYPHCIASYDRCDGIAQCPDGSDEVDCQGGEYPLDYTNKGPIDQAEKPPVAPLLPPELHPPPKLATPAPLPDPRPVLDAHRPPEYPEAGPVWNDRKTTAPGSSAMKGEQRFEYPDDRRVPDVAGREGAAQTGGARMETSSGRSSRPPSSHHSNLLDPAVNPHQTNGPAYNQDSHDKDLQDLPLMKHLSRSEWEDEQALHRKRPDINTNYKTTANGKHYQGYGRDRAPYEEDYGQRGHGPDRPDDLARTYGPKPGPGVYAGDPVYDRPPSSGANYHRNRFANGNAAYRDYYEARPGADGPYAPAPDGYDYRNYPPYGGQGTGLGDNLSGSQGSSSRRRPIVEADHPPAATSGPQPPPPSRPNGGEVAHDLSAAVGPETPKISPKKGNFIGHDQRGPDERNEARPRVADGYHTSLAGYHNALAEMNSSPVEKTSATNDAERVAKVDAVQTKPVVEPDAAPKAVVPAPTAPVRTNISPATRRPDVAKPLASVDGAPGPLIVSKIEIDSASGGQLENAEAETTFLEYSGDLQGAIIALALGLSITAVLLVFVVCKLRNVKRRLRRGRLASHDADYLINGMYL